jgi:hypothetical protein
MFRHSPEAPIVDLPIVEVIDLVVVVVIRFVAMEVIPRRRIARDGCPAKAKIQKKKRVPESSAGEQQSEPLYARTVSSQKTVPHFNLSSQVSKPYVVSIAR